LPPWVCCAKRGTGANKKRTRIVEASVAGQGAGSCFALIISEKHNTMNMLNRFNQLATLCGCALLLCFSLTAGADELQDISKLLKQGKQEQALTRVNAYLVSKPKDAQGRFLKGLILTDQNKTDDAIRIFSGLTEDYPELPEPYNNLAVLYASQGQYDKARIALEMAIRTHPSYATAHENLGDIYAKMASQAYDRALQLDHGNTGTQTKLAMIKDIFATGTAKGGKSGKTTHKGQAVTAPSPETDAAAPAPTVASAIPHAATTTQVASATATTAPESVTASVKQAVVHKTTTANNSDNVLKSVHEWVAAWSAKNVKGYLAFYAEDFKTPGNVSRADWEAQRNDRISKPKSIQVGISNAKVKFIDDSHASVSFKQSYHASHLKNIANKTLVLVKSGDNWLIQEERSGK
jgi:tetratricopeptide (TPR) repeat protein